MNEQKLTPADLFTNLKNAYRQDDIEELDIKTLRYVLYARRSTTNDERQERSIPDQIADCYDRVIVPKELNIIGAVREEKGSAKEPNTRPAFRTMLEDIKSGKIDGIVAWHPDRLARNMMDAGEIIDLLDKGILKDIQFATSSFENSPTGKMLLGISFVLSKQYSEHLSENIKRGNRRMTEDGLFLGKMKHGYLISDDRLFPDNWFTNIKTAFQMRLEGSTQEAIVQALNRSDYRVRKRGKDPEKYKWDKDSVSSMLKDPVYAGVLKYGNNLVKLEDHYDFMPVVTVEEFMSINKISDLKSPALVSSMLVKESRDTLADLMRGRVYCGFCNKPFTSSITSKRSGDNLTHYYYYRCESDGCVFKNSAVRASKMIEFAANYLEQHSFTTQSNYDEYVTDSKQYAHTQKRDITSSIARYTKIISDKQGEYDRAKKLVAQKPELSKHYDLDALSKEVEVFTQEQQELQSKRDSLGVALLTYQEYLELFSQTGVILRQSGDMAKLDAVLRKFFLNFTIKAYGKGSKQRCDITCTLNEPFAGFVRTGNFEHGRGDRT